MKYLPFFILTLLCCHYTYAAELAVPSQYNTIEDALNAATDNDEIILAPGTYSGSGNTDITINGLTATIRSQDPEDASVVAQTIIDCEDNSRAFILSNNTGALTIKGITISNGNSTAGGAILVTSSSLSLYNCIINSCTSNSDGGAIAVTSGSVIISQGSIFINNTAANDGGAIYSSGDSVITLQDSIFSQNSSDRDGGAIACSNNNSDVLIDTCSVIGNKSTDFGGGINFTYLTRTQIQNSVIAGNFADSHGGGIYYSNSTYESDTPSNLIINSTITENRSAANGGGLRLFDSELELANTVIWNNSVTVDGQYQEVAISGDNSLLQMAFCLIQGSLDDDFDNEYVFLELGSLVERLGGNISGPPSFTSTGSWADEQWTPGNYLPTSGSFCFNGGSTDYIDEQLTLDFAGEDRIKGLTVDIGAFEMDIPDGSDLTATLDIDLKYTGDIIPGDKGKAIVTVTNIGNEDAEGEISVSLYMSTDQYLDSSDTLLYSPSKKTKVKFLVDKLKPKAFKLSFIIPGDIDTGTYYILAHVDAENDISEADESMISNIIASEQQTLAWKFGSFGTRNNAKLILEDSQGITNQYLIKDGWGEIDSNRSDINITSTSQKCTLTVKPMSKDGTPELGSITCTGDLSINAKTHNLAGDIYITGTMPKFVINDAIDGDTGYTITVLGSSTDEKTGATIQALNISDLNIYSPDYPIKSIKVNKWLNSSQPPVIETPWIKSISCKENFEASLRITGENADKNISIGSAKIGANIENASWEIEGDIKSISANALINFALFHGTSEGVSEPTGNTSDITNQYSLSLSLKDSNIAMQDSTIITWEVSKFSFSGSAVAEGSCYFEFFSSRKPVPLPGGVLNPASNSAQTSLMLNQISSIWQPELKNIFNLF